MRNRKWTERTLKQYLEELRLDDVIARDELSQADMLMADIPGGYGKGAPRPWTDEDAISLLSHLQQTTNTAKLTMLNTVLSLTAVENAYNPLQAKFEALPKWDRVPRIENFLVKALGLDIRDTDRALYVRAISKRFMWAIVSRAMDPGIKFDCMLILEGAQGLGKSRFCKALAFANDEWFTDSLPPITGPMIKDAREQLMGKMIVEMGELAQFKGSHIEALKGFLSTSTDTVRLPYARRSGIYRRSCVLVGTTNEKQYLSDITGNRRFWPVECGDIDLDYVEANLEQAYAEALHDWRRSKVHDVHLELWLPDHIAIIAKEEQEARREMDPLEESVSDYVDKQFRQEAGSTGISYPGYFFVSAKSYLEDHENLSISVEQVSDPKINSRLQKVGRILQNMSGNRVEKVTMHVSRYNRETETKVYIRERRYAYRFVRPFSPEKPQPSDE